MAKHFAAEPTVLGDEVVSVRAGRIEVVGGGQTLLVGTERKRIGRGAQCDLVLDDKTVSAIHLEVEATPMGVRFVDLASRNGTYLGENRIIEAYLTTASEVRCGKTRLLFTPTSPEDVRAGQVTRFGALVGTTAEMVALFERLAKFAKSDLSVVILGETGTGKELAARAIHDASPRRAKPFVAINCAAMSEQLLEAELFGHEKGAFTGADRARSGLFADADGGTLFLDEIAEMSPGMQAKLLRVLQEGEVRPIGTTRPRKVDVRTLSATHGDLSQAVNDARFRADLFFRLAQVTVELPPLRKRLGDIPLLAHQTLEDLGRPGAKIDDATMDLLKGRSWPGNVRQLRSAIEVAIASGDGETLVFDEAFSVAHTRQKEPPLETLRFDDAKREFKRRYYGALYASCRGNVTQIARRAGKQRSTVREALREAGLDVGPSEND